MNADVLAHAGARARLATTIGIPLYTVFGGIGLWAATALWNRVVCDDVLAPSVLGGPTAAIGAASAVAVVVGIAGVSSLSRSVFPRIGTTPVRRVALGAALGAAGALVPSILIVIGCLHPAAGIAATMLGLVLPAALTGAVGGTLVGRVEHSSTLIRLFVAAKWFAVVVVGLWAVLEFAPLDRWTLLACAVG